MLKSFPGPSVEIVDDTYFIGDAKRVQEIYNPSIVIFANNRKWVSLYTSVSIYIYW